VKFGCSVATCLLAPGALRVFPFALFAESRSTPRITSDTLQVDQEVDPQVIWAELAAVARPGDREVIPSRLAKGLVLPRE